MKLEHLPGSIVTLLNRECKPAGEVQVDLNLMDEQAYRVWWTYAQTGERELIRVPEFRLVKKTFSLPTHK